MPTAAKNQAAPRPKPKSDAEKTVLDVAVGSPDHTTLVAAVQAAGLVDALASPGGIYTVFAPTNAAFDKLPPGTVEDLLKPENKASLRKIIQHHAAVPVVPLASMQEGQVLSMSDGTKVTLHRVGEKVSVEGANILGTVNAVNGVVYVVDAVVLPPS
jgi:uncharacterized surface protein with fasciclin (FAS1) repeats